MIRNITFTLALVLLSFSAKAQDVPKEMYIGDFCQQYSVDIMLKEEQRIEGEAPFKKRLLWQQIPDTQVLNIVDMTDMSKAEKSILRGVDNGNLVIRDDTLYMDDLELGAVKDYLPSFCVEYVPDLDVMPSLRE